MADVKSRARRKISKLAILEAALKLFADEGEAGFSIRKLAMVIGVDPMTILHHFQSKDGLLRAIAAQAIQSIDVPVATASWQNDLRTVAEAYRELARQNPRIFHLHFRYYSTSPTDHIEGELVYSAMRRAGLSDRDAVGLGLAFYAFVLGFALAEAEGLLRPISDDDAAELDALDPVEFKTTRELVPSLKALDPAEAFAAATTAFIDGICDLARREPPKSLA
ncbi:TetR family transcriptional regulator [Hyphomicrobium methylovorum]|nr:TetR family transcriptional regulator [Hyphomicrobium methylovorum]